MNEPNPKPFGLDHPNFPEWRLKKVKRAITNFMNGGMYTPAFENWKLEYGAFLTNDDITDILDEATREVKRRQDEDLGIDGIDSYVSPHMRLVKDSPVGLIPKPAAVPRPKQEPAPQEAEIATIKPAFTSEEEAELAAMRKAATEWVQEEIERSAIITEEQIAPLVTVLEAVIGGDGGPLAELNDNLARQKRKQLTVKDVAFVAWVHRDSILQHEDGASATWRPVKNAERHTWVAKITKNHVGGVFRLLETIGFAKKIREHTVGNGKQQGECAAYSYLNKPIFERCFEVTE